MLAAKLPASLGVQGGQVLDRGMNNYTQTGPPGAPFGSPDSGEAKQDAAEKAAAEKEETNNKAAAEKRLGQHQNKSAKTD